MSSGRCRSAVRGRLGVRLRVTLVASTVTLVTLTAGGVLLVGYVHRAQLGGLDSALRARAADVSLIAARGSLPQIVATTGEDSSLVQVLDSTGTVVASSANIQGELPALPANPRVRRPSLGNRHDLPISDAGQSFRVLAHPVELVNGPGWIYVATSLGPVDAAVSRLVQGLLLWVPLLSLAIAGIIWLAVGRALRPVEAIRSRAAGIGAGDLTTRVPVPGGRDVIALLAQTVNEMLSRLQAASDRQRRFLGDASHELKSPLTALRAQVDVALADPTGANPSEVLRGVQQQARRMTQVIDDLLFLAHTDEQGPTAAALPTDLDDIVLGEVHRLRASTANRVDVTRLDAARVLGRRRDLTRLVRNVTANAVAHATHAVQVDLVTDHDSAVLTVSDDGPGIPEADRARVFERFTRLDDHRARNSAGGGTGLGLAISRDIAEAHRGTLTVSGRADGTSGAVFRLWLPLADPRVARVEG